MSAVQRSCRLEPPVPRPRLYAGADQPARLSLEIDSIEDRARIVPVISRDVLQMPFCALSMLVRSDRAHLPKVFVVAPLSGHFPILLRDLLIGLLPDFEVYFSDWVNARHVPNRCGPFDLEANVSYIAEMIEHLGPGLNVIALCQAGVPALVATAHLSEKNARCAPRSLVLMAAPVDPGSNPTRIVRLIRAKPLSWYKRNVIRPVLSPYRGKGRLVYPASAQLLGLQTYLGRHLCEGGELFSKMFQDDGCEPQRFPFADLYSALMDLPAELFLDIIRHIYKESSLWNRTLTARGQLVDFTAIRSTALMTVEGENDDVAAPGQTRRAHDLCVSIPAAQRRRLVVPRCGHFSLFHGEVWRAHVLPAVRAFIGKQGPAGAGAPV